MAAAPARPPVLTVSELDVVDPQGVIRARVGGDLPDAVINGKPVPRGQKAAGVLLYDDTGEERGGYITFSPDRQVALTLDNHGTVGLTGIFVADADAAEEVHGCSGSRMVPPAHLRGGVSGVPEREVSPLPDG